MPNIITEYPQFFTATIQDWKRLLAPDKYKAIIIESLRFLVTSTRIKLNAFVIMENHVHLSAVVGVRADGHVAEQPPTTRILPAI